MKGMTGKEAIEVTKLILLGMAAKKLLEKVVKMVQSEGSPKMSPCDECKHPEECQIGCYTWIYHGEDEQ